MKKWLVSFRLRIVLLVLTIVGIAGVGFAESAWVGPLGLGKGGTVPTRTKTPTPRKTATKTVTKTPPPGQGCTPGYWKNHLKAWDATGYSPTDDFDATFGVNLFNPNITLVQALNLGGGGVNRLARHGTAALLNAADPDVNYPYTVAQVIALVQAGNADKLEAANELGCPLN